MADLTECPPLPTSAAFTVSWRSVLLEMAWAVPLALGAFLLFVWLSGGAVDAWLLGFAAAIGASLFFWQLLTNRLRGVAEVRIEPEALTVRGRGGWVRRVARADLVGMWHHDYGEGDWWLIEGRHGRVTIRPAGFRFSDWQDLSAMLRRWRDAGPVASQPGVAIDPGGRAGRGVTFEPYLPTRVKAGAVGMAAVGALMALSGLGMVWEGIWLEAPWVTIVTVSFGLLFAGCVAAASLWTARRVEFADAAVHIQVYFGVAWAVPYADVFPGAGMSLNRQYGQVDTQYGLFLVGPLDGPVLARLLAERRTWTPKSGSQRDVGPMRWVRQAVLIGMLGGGVLLSYLADRLGAAWGLTLGGVWVLTFVLLMASGATLWAGIRLWTRHHLRHADD